MPQETFAASRITPEEAAPDLGKGRRIANIVAWASVALAALAGLAELMGGMGYRMRWWGAGAGIYTLGIGAMAATAAFVIALAALFIAWLAGVRRTMIVAVLGLALGALLAGPPLLMWRQAATVPAIHDITTDTENPPLFVAILPKRAGAPNGVEYSPEAAPQQKTAYPDIVPAILPQSPARALDLADRAARDMGWEIVAISPPDLRIEATATTRLFGFQDDVVVRITPWLKGSRVDVRSLSRVGKSDVGTNARRIRTYLNKLTELSRTEG
jgi:uncharacterized protein (DUF1499 family)